MINFSFFRDYKIFIKKLSISIYNIILIINFTIISSLLDCSPDFCLFLASFLSSFFFSFFSFFFFSSFGFSASSFWLFPRGFWLKAFFLLRKAKRNLLKGKKKITKKTEKTIRMKKMKKATKTNKKLVTIPATN